MSKIIEICGSPGSGKTTIYNALVASWRKGFSWAPTQYPVRNIDYSSPGRFLSTAWKKIKKEKDFAALDKAGDRFVAAFPEYMDNFWKSHFLQPVKNYSGVDLRFRNISVFWSTLRKIQYQRESKHDEVLIACEGLIQRIGNGWYKSCSLDEDKKEAARLIDTMPLPDAVVYLQVDVESTVKRIQTRKKMLPAHKCLSVEELEQVTRNNHERWLFICALLEKKGIPVLRLNSGNEIGANAKKISEFAKMVRDGQDDSIIHTNREASKMVVKPKPFNQQ